MAMDVNFYNVEAKDGSTAAERYAALTKDANSFYGVASDLYWGEIKLTSAADLAAAVANIAQNAADIVTINNTLTKLENTESTSGSIRNIIRSYLDALNSGAGIASKTGKKITISSSIAQVAGLISATGTPVEFADVASTGAAEDVTYDNTNSGLLATDVQAALNELAQASAGGVASKTVHMADESAGQSAYAKVYKIYQGADNADMTKNVLVGTINVPKDKVVQSGKIVTVTNGQDSDGDATSVADGTYIKLVLQNVDNPLYINVADLIDDYTAAQNAPQVQIAISDQNVISATIVSGSITATELASNAVTTAKILDANVTKAKLAQGVQDSLDLADSAVQSVAEGATAGTIAVDGTDVAVHGLADVATSGNADDVAYDNTTSGMTATDVQGAVDELKDALDNIDVSGDIDTAIEALDTASDVGIASSSNDIITISGSIKEEDGIVKKGTATDVTLAKIAATGAAVDASVADTGSNFVSQTKNVETILAEIAGHLTWQTI